MACALISKFSTNIHGHNETLKHTFQPLLYISFADVITFLPKIMTFSVTHLLWLSFLKQKIFYNFWLINMKFETQLVKIDDICHVFFFFLSKWLFSAISKFTTYHNVIFFDATWFQLLFLVFVQSFMSKAFIKKFLYNFSFYKCLAWFYNFLESWL